MTPNGFAEIVKAYGDPRDFVGTDGWLSPEESRRWEMRLGLTRIQFPEPIRLSFGHPDQVATSMRCHPAAEKAFRGALELIHRERLWHELKTYGGCFMPRMQRGSADRWSTHTWGIAIDLDVLNNKLGDTPRISLAVVQIFEAYGFTWGGRWPHRPDGQHFQLATGY